MSYIFMIAAAAALLLSLAPLSPWQPAVVALAVNFLLLIALGTLLLMLLAAALKMPVAVHALCAAALLAVALQCAPHLWPRAGARNDGIRLRVLHANVYRLNKNPVPLLSLIATEKPDIVTAAEVTGVFARAFAALGENYPHRKIIARDNNSFGIAVLSRHPLEDVAVHDFSGHDIPSVSFTVKDVKFFALHPANPVFAAAARDAELAALSDYLAQHGPHVLVGDLNATVFTRPLKDLMRRHALASAAPFAGTYPAYLPWPLRLPIDHVLMPAGVDAVSFRKADAGGSDHFPIIADLSIEK